MKLWMAFYSFAISVIISAPAFADGKVLLDLPGIPPGQAKKVAVEAMRVDLEPPVLAYRGDAAEASEKGIDLRPGRYHVYIEDQRTGLILPLDNNGQGYVVSDGATAIVTGAGFDSKIKEIKQKDKTEKTKHAEKAKGKKGGTLAVGGDPAAPEAGEDYIPGDLLIKYAPGTTLADRYAVLVELAAESRNKLSAIEVYRVKIDETADLGQIIQSHADDSRISYMEMNQMVSIPEPLGSEDTRR